MVWFYCDGCGDSIKKPKLAGHMRQCRAAYSFSCIDCSRTFDAQSVHSHTSCVTEHEKYALGATKAGGFAEKGFVGAEQTQGEQREAVGLQFLATRPPWKCTICNVTCTSESTLQGHAAGAKHQRRAKAAIAAANGEGKADSGGDAANGQKSQPEAPKGDENDTKASDAPAADECTKSKKKKKKKSRESDMSGASADGEEDAAEKAEKKKKKKKKHEGEEESKQGDDKKSKKEKAKSKEVSDSEGEKKKKKEKGEKRKKSGEKESVDTEKTPKKSKKTKKKDKSKQ